MTTPGAYYNENDPYAAEYIRWLMAGGLIMPGDVDTRSIEDVCPDDLQGYTQHHFFAGMGVWSYALRGARWPDDRRIWTGSCPCQPFSASGKGGGFADERHLWPAFFHLITNCRPERVAGEQVASRDGLSWLDLVSSDMEGADYAFRAVPLCSAGFGSPDIRNRMYWMANADGSGLFPEPFAGIHRGEESRRSRHGELERPRSTSDRVGDAERARSQGHGGQRRLSEGGEQIEISRPTKFGRLAIADDAKRGSDGSGGNDGERCDAGRPEGASHLEGRCAPSGMANADGRDEGNGDLQRSGEHGQFAENGGARYERHSPGPVNGRWALADWLFCRDGRWRPVEPGTFPLVDGAPARMGRLRAAGNAINAEVARHFIEAVMADD